VAAPTQAPVLPAWSALPPADEDPGLEVLRAVASVDADIASAFDRNPAVQDLLSDLSDEESQALAETLRARVGRGGEL